VRVATGVVAEGVEDGEVCLIDPDGEPHDGLFFGGRQFACAPK
jgi:hypothetical protein